MEDIDLEAYTDYELKAFVKVDKPVTINVTSDEGDEWTFTLDADKHNVRNLKQAILNKKPKPFILCYPSSNTDSLMALPSLIQI